MVTTFEQFIVDRFPSFSHQKQVDAVKVLRTLCANPCRSLEIQELADLSGAEPFRLVPILFEFSHLEMMVTLLFSSIGELCGVVYNENFQLVESDSE